MEMLKKYGLSVVVLTATVIFTGCFTNKGSDVQSQQDDKITDVAPGEIEDETYVEGDTPMSNVDFEDMSVVNVTFTPVYFGYNTFTIPSSEMSKVSALAEYMIAEPNYCLMIYGHCDERGTIEYNVSLGEYRAQSIRDVLIKLGVEAYRIKTASLGEEMPADPGHNEAAWRQNRRGEFIFFTR
ncbi:MAG: OmpA family protein [Kiritimatiellae bacterium]|nr:OmpA family protein [Kiritimatiellia bacterium]